MGTFGIRAIIVILPQELIIRSFLCNDLFFKNAGQNNDAFISFNKGNDFPIRRDDDRLLIF
jgi:hypothetical protein